VLPILRVNTDALVVGTDDPVEAKTHGLFGPGDDESWGEDETDHVPDRVTVQCHAHMLAWNKDICHVPALIGRRGLYVYHVPRSRELSDLIVEQVGEFWDKNVKADTPPENVVPSLEIIKRVRRVPDKIADIPPEIMQRWLEAKEAFSAAEDAEKSAKASLLAALGDAEAGHCGEFGGVTYYESPRKAYTVPASNNRRLTHRPKGL
jgi:predicted phage-related endonuclease